MAKVRGNAKRKETGKAGLGSRESEYDKETRDLGIVMWERRSGYEEGLGNEGFGGIYEGVAGEFDRSGRGGETAESA